MIVSHALRAAAALVLLPAPAFAQIVGVAVLDSPSERQAQRDANRFPYASPYRGDIATGAVAAKACGHKAAWQAGPGASVIGNPSAQTMSTGWEVYGEVGFKGEPSIPFVCSVRNGSVSGILLRDR